MTHADATTYDYLTERRAPEGYAVGTTDSGEWLTLLGSHWEAMPLFRTAEQAEAWFAQRWPQPIPGREYITRWVERKGRSYFKIVEDAP